MWMPGALVLVLVLVVPPLALEALALPLLAVELQKMSLLGLQGAAVALA